MTNQFNVGTTYRNGEYAGYENNCYKYIAVSGSSGHLPTNTDYWELICKNIYGSITNQILDQIKYPPASPYAFYKNDNNINTNFLQGNLYQFRVKYTYDDNEQSIWSDISNIPLPQNTETGVGIFTVDKTIDNTIEVQFNTGSSIIKRIELAVRINNIGLWMIEKIFDKYNTDGDRISGFEDNITYNYDFQNNNFQTPLDQADTERLYDSVPQISNHITIIEKNRLLFANYIDGYDSVDINMRLSCRYNQIDFVGYNNNFTIPYDSQFGLLVYTGAWNENKKIWYNKFLGSFESSFRPGCVCYLQLYNENDDEIPVSMYISPTETYSDFLVRLVAKINMLPAYDQTVYTPILPAGISGEPMVLVSFRAMKISNDIMIDCRSSLEPTKMPPAILHYSIFGRIYSFSGIRVPCFKTGAWHYFGITYFDRGDRSGGVNVCDGSTIYIPHPTELANGRCKDSIMVV